MLKGIISILGISALAITNGFAQLNRVDAKQESKRNAPELKENQVTTIDDYKMYIVEKRNLKHYAIPNVQLKNIVTERISNPSNESSLKFPTEFNASVSISIERKRPIAFILIPNYIKANDGSILHLKSYDIDIQEQNTTSNKTTGNRVYATNSVLASGNWYEISLKSQGIYKITHDFIQNSLGVNPATINPTNIRVYGNGGTVLPEDNAIFRPDDLVENAIQVIDGGDGTFDAGDYILFYATGPHATVKDSINKSFTHQFNIYSDDSHYFLNFDLGAGKRVQLQTATLSPNVNVNSYNSFAFYEKDSANLGHFGKDFFGEEFSDQPGRVLTRTFSFDVSNLDASAPVSVRTRIGSIHSSGISVMNVSANGLPLQSIQFQPIGFSFSDPVLRMSDFTSSTSISSSPLNLTFSYSKGNSSAVGYLDFIEVNCRRNLSFNGFLSFADWNSVASGNIASYSISNCNSNTQVWDVTNPLLPSALSKTLNSTNLNFVQEASSLHQFIAFDGSVVSTPNYLGKVVNQNLHNSSAVDYIIIAPDMFKAQAEQLAQYHAQKRGYRTKVVSPQEIYNEFSSGTQDVSAIRDYLKMLYDKAGPNDIPDYVLFFGDASYDYKNRINNNTNIVPTYETNESNNKTTGYCTDDFFGFLDDNENIDNYSFSQVNTLDIGIGRFPVSSTSKAADIINKIVKYDSPQSFGPWKNNMTFNADDGDSNTHLDDAEIMSNSISDSLPEYNIYKIYVDGFVQQSTPAGPRSPDANAALTAQMYNGVFLMNYNGHGGPLGWCEERIFSMDDINSLTNLNKLPLFITATCDFAPFDNPAIESAGEILLTKSNGGAIALMTTTQLVYADQNRIMNLNYVNKGFEPMENGFYPTLGDSYRMSKNLRYVTSIDEFAASNFRKFALLGDPGLPLAFPKHTVKTDSINGISVTVSYDTLKALGQYTINGHVEDKNGNLLNNFNGIVYPTIFDKPKKLTTLKNDPDSKKQDYYIQNNALYKGKASVKNGKFSFTFVVPKDINYDIAKGKISYYAENGVEDANGYENQVSIGGSSSNPKLDNEGPIIKAYMNDEKFVNGGIVTPNSILLLKLYDDNGINYTGNSIGHDITAILDDNSQKTYVLNNFFEADLDDYRAGTVRFPVSNLTVGEHSFTIKAWDVFNNSSEVKINFVVTETSDGKLAHVYNYPNPFTTHTEFMFEHNMPNQNLYVAINIYTVTGKVVKSIRTLINTPGTRANGIEWDGRDQYGERLGKGVYLYKLSVKSQNGFSDDKIQKLVLLQ